MFLIYQFIRIILYPFLRFVLPLFSSNAKKRIEFELKNYVNMSSLQRAEYGFEVSSEGELEQVKALIMHLISDDKTIEILYCSESVERQCQNLQSEYPHQVRAYRYPILTYFPLRKSQNIFTWMTCSKLFLCRYDFFPELIYYGYHKASYFALISGVMKNFSSKGFFSRYYLKSVYKKFHKIIAVTTEGKNEFSSLLPKKVKIKDFDFRAVQISNRLKDSRKTMNLKVPHYRDFLSFIEGFDHSKRIVFGSFWPIEIDLLKPDFDYSSHLVCLAPHNLDEESIAQLKGDCINKAIPLYELNSQTSAEEFKRCQNEHQKNPGIWLLNFKGVLCELYSLFGHAYVGGGFGKSVHSLMEPYMAGSIVYCGPKVHRSTEFDLIKEYNPQRVNLIELNADFLSLVFSFNTSKIESLDKFNAHINEGYKPIIEWIISK